MKNTLKKQYDFWGKPKKEKVNWFPKLSSARSRLPRKSLSYAGARIKYNLNPFMDADRDKRPNFIDCKPFDKKKHMAWNIERNRMKGSRIVMMSPKRYLQITGLPHNEKTYYDEETGQMTPIKELAKHIKSPTTKVTIPFTGVNREKIIKDYRAPKEEVHIFKRAYHEGRHRAMAAQIAGQEKIPVKVPYPEYIREEIGEKFIEKAFPEQKDSSYKSELRRRFKEEFPEDYPWDKDKAKILAKVQKEYQDKKYYDVFEYEPVVSEDKNEKDNIEFERKEEPDAKKDDYEDNTRDFETGKSVKEIMEEPAEEE